MENRRRLLVALALVALVALAAHGLDHEKEEKEEKAKKIKEAIEEVAEHAEKEKGFLKELFEKVEEQIPEHYHVVVHDLKQEHETKLFGLLVHETVEKFEKKFGVWVFKCGKFENEGHHGHEHHIHSKEHSYTIDEGEEIIFYNEHCPNHSYREKHQLHD